MFLPLGLEYSYERRAFVTIGFLAINVLVAVRLWTSGADDFGGFALDPSDFRVYQLITSSFLHAGPFHLLGNMLFLWIFGRYVEDRLGWWRFGAGYLACAVFGDLAQLAFGGPLPSVGASGAVAGLMGYVLVAAPWMEVRCYLFIGPPGSYGGKPVEIAAGWLLGFWIAMQLIEAFWVGSGHVALAAHIGGFALGAAAAGFMRSRYCLGTSWYIDPRPPEGGRAAVDRLRQARGAPRTKS